MPANLSESFATALEGYRPGRISRLLHASGHLLYSKLLEIYAKRCQVPVWRTAETFWGDEMQVVFPERVSMTLFRYGFFERGLTEIMLQTLTPGMTFFDVGAHFGYYSLLAATIVGVTGAVHSFEPTPSTFEVLKRNTATKPNIRINNVAMWSKREPLEFRDYGVTYSAFNSISSGDVRDNMRDGLEGKPCTVEATTVDDYVRETGASPNLLKLDAEGAELNIIRGMSETISRLRPALTVEVGDDPSGDDCYSRQLLDAVIAHGYEPFEAVDGKIVPHRLLNRYEYDNILLKPAS